MLCDAKRLSIATVIGGAIVAGEPHRHVVLEQKENAIIIRPMSVGMLPEGVVYALAVRLVRCVLVVSIAGGIVWSVV